MGFFLWRNQADAPAWLAKSSPEAVGKTSTNGRDMQRLKPLWKDPANWPTENFGACDKRLQRRYGLPPWFFPRFIIYVGVVEFLYVYPLCGQTHSDRMAPQKLRQRSGCQESSTALDGIVANAISHFFGVGLRLADEKSWLFHFGFSPHTWWVTACFAPASGWTIPAAQGVRPSHKFHQISQNLRRFFNSSSKQTSAISPFHR